MTTTPDIEQLTDPLHIVPAPEAEPATLWDEMLCEVGLHDLYEKLIALADEFAALRTPMTHCAHLAEYAIIDHHLRRALDLINGPRDE